MTNKQLDLCISKIATGNRDALRQLYDEMKKPIFLFALSLVKDYQTAEDVEQETFLRIMQSAKNYKIGTNPKAWVFSIARNCSVDNFKKRNKYIPLDTDYMRNIPEKEDQLVKVENTSLVLEALGQLNEDERTIVSLYLFAGLKQTEISKVLNLPYLSVRSKYGYAIKKLRHYFDTEGVHFNE